MSNASDPATDCNGENNTIVMLFIEASNPGYSEHRLNDIMLLVSLAVLGTVFNAILAGVLLRNSAYKQSANATLMLHLSFADLMVALFCLMADAIWNITMQWLGGNVLCRLVKFMQMFSLYATTLILTGMTLERCITVTFPISKSGRQDTLRRAKVIAIFVWVIAALCSIPQAVIFHVERAPICVDFYQCVTHGFYSSPAEELAYTMSTLCLMFLIPLIIICLCYVIIFANFSKEAQQALGDRVGHDEEKHSSFLTVPILATPKREPARQGERLYRRARRTTLWMTFVIALTFVVCWTPYSLTMFTHYFSWPISPETIHALLCFGMSNSVLNPLIFGAFQCSAYRTRKALISRDGNGKSTGKEHSHTNQSSLHDLRLNSGIVH